MSFGAHTQEQGTEFSIANVRGVHRISSESIGTVRPLRNTNKGLYQEKLRATSG